MGSTAGDVFCEVLVKSKKSSKEKGMSVLLIMLGILASAAILLFLPAMFILIVLIVLGVVYGLRYQSSEYEYIFTSGAFDIDRIVGGMKRKKMMSLNFETLEVLAPEGSQELSGYSNPSYKVYNYSANDPNMKNYVFVGSTGNSLIKVIFTPNEKMLDKMYGYAPRKVKRV